MKAFTSHLKKIYGAPSLKAAENELTVLEHVSRSGRRMGSKL